MSGILPCKHSVKWTEIFCVKNVNCLHYQRWVCADESTALTQSLELWDVFKAKLDVPKNPIVTTLLPPSPVLGLLGSAARPGTPHGLVPDQSTGRVTCCPSPPPWDTPEHWPAGCRRVCFQLITNTYRDSQAVTQTLLYCSLQVFLAAAVF